MSHPGNIYSDTHQRAALKARFPRQFACQHIGQDWPDGWHHLVTEVCEVVDRSGLDIRWSQLKEKFGGLKMYRTGHELNPSPALEQIQTLINQAEEKSLRTCCKCARVGDSTQVGGWWLTLCASCKPLVEAYKQLPWSQRDAQQE
ncbi:MAG: hypothetical protein ACT4QA_08050 [Panacagrimonas sp.]